MHVQTAADALDYESAGIVVEDVMNGRIRLFKLKVLNKNAGTVIDVNDVTSRNIYLLV